MALNPLIDCDLSFTAFTARVKELLPQGYQPLSLSMYGNPFDPRFSAVWDKRPGPPWKWYPATFVADLKNEYAKNKAAGFYPALVAATGGGKNTRVTAVFEKLALPETRELTFHQDINAFATEVGSRGKGGWMIKSATIYDDATNESGVAAVWEKNSANVAWTAFVGMDSGQHQAVFDAEWSGAARLAFVTGSTRGKFLAVYRDDQIGPIWAGFIPRKDLTLEQFLADQKAWLGKGFHTVCFQGYGPDNARRYAAIYVNNEIPVQRTTRATGEPAVPDIDNAVFDLMKRSNIRGASLAIVKGTRLVLARGYTWAEPDYPDVQPTTLFRLASCSKLVAAIAIHQLVAEGIIKLESKVATVLPLTPPNELVPANVKYTKGEVHGLLEWSTEISPRYEPAGPEIVAAFAEGPEIIASFKFKPELPVTHEQIASFWITKPLVTDSRLDDFGYFLAGQIVKKERGTDPNTSIIDAIASRITKPLQITRIRSGRSLLSAQLEDEARYHPRDLGLNQSVMTKERPLVPSGYGDGNLETMETSGGLSAAAVDLARILAAMNASPYTPLGRPSIDGLLKSAVAKGGGHGFDSVTVIDQAKGIFEFPKGGLLDTSQSGLLYSRDGFSYVILWNGQHTGTGPVLNDTGGWYPKFNKVVDAAVKQPWPATDLFSTKYKMDSFPATQGGWLWCSKCQGLFFADTNLGNCPAGGTHVKSKGAVYALMHNSKLAYGQANWRWCNKCQGLFFGGAQQSKCPAGGSHDKSTSGNYSLVLDSPYKEHQQNWRWCSKCQGLVFAGYTKGVCPAGGTHDPSSSGNYRLAWS
jgi:CubicO group peptidase (beta-lactamase class C family)